MPRNIVVLVDRFDGLGGIQRWANQIASEFAHRGYQVHMVGISPPNKEHVVAYNRPESVTAWYCSANQTRTYSGVLGRTRYLVTRLPRPMRESIDKILSGWRPNSLDGASAKRLRAKIEAIGKGSVLLCSSPVLLAYVKATGLKVGAAHGLPVVAQYHNSFSVVAQKRRALRSFKKLYASADSVVFLTSEDARLARTHHILNVTHIPNPSPSVRCSEPMEKRELIVAAVARLDSQKSVDYLIRAWARIASQFPAWSLRIYGDGPQLPLLRRLAARLQVEVSFEGVVDDPMSALGEARIHAMTSQAEGWGLVVSEAAAVGTPTVAFDSGAGIRAQIIDGETGIIVPKNDLGQLVQALEALMSEEHRLSQMGTNARAALERYHVARIIREWEELFDAFEREP